MISLNFIIIIIMYFIILFYYFSFCSLQTHSFNTWETDAGSQLTGNVLITFWQMFLKAKNKRSSKMFAQSHMVFNKVIKMLAQNH